MLVVSEIYRSVLGESVLTGRLCSVVRLVGCHRRCGYCDSAYAFAGGREMDVDAVLAEVEALAAGTVLVTGGEPLLQGDCLPLLERLVAAGLAVVLETSGTVGAASLADVPDGVTRVVDVKTPGSGVPADQVAWDQLGCLGAGDELKFVCVDRTDYEWARGLILDGGRLPAGPTITLSPAHDLLVPSDLADWIVADALDVRLQVQLHRLVWPDRDRGV